MSREVEHNGEGAFHVRFPFDRGLVELIKSLPNRRWNAGERFWAVPEEDAVLLVDLLRRERFRFDATTVEIYVDRGGDAEIQAAPRIPPSGTGMRSLFEDPREREPVNPAAGDLTVSGLNERVKHVIESAFPDALWLVGEISGFNRNAHKRHVGFKLVEHDDSGRSVSSIDATLFEQSRRNLERRLARAGEPFRLEDEVAVRMLVRVELYAPWGSYRIVVEDIDVNFTLGEAARRREEILRRLTGQGLVDRNTALEFPPVPLRVGLITSLGSDAYNDVIQTLGESGLAFRILAHGARVQGRATEPSVLNALDALRERAAELDVVLICRGGGSRTDLAWFDSEALGRAVALFPVPVVVGIGHEQDHSVLDAVGWRCKTPTAAAAFLVETARKALNRTDELGQRVLEQARRVVTEKRRAGGERARRLVASVRGLLERERAELGHRRGRTARAALGRLALAREQIARAARGVPRAGLVEIARQRGSLDHLARTLASGARRDAGAARDRLDLAARTLAPRARRLLALEGERRVSRERRLFLIDPRRVVERGYAILRLEGGPVIRSPATAPPGSRVEAELRDGRLKLRVETGAKPGEGV